MRLAKLTGLEIEALENEIAEVQALIARLESILASDAVLTEVMVGELEDVLEQYGDERRTRIDEVEGEIDIEDLIAQEEMVVTVTHGGYVKRNSKTLYRAQRRGGRGVTGASAHEEDFVAQVFVANTHDVMLMFTNQGRCYSKKIYEIPQAGRTAKVKPSLTSFRFKRTSGWSRCCPCAHSPKAPLWSWRPNGASLKTSLSAFAAIRASGIIGLTIDEGDALVGVGITEGTFDILLGTSDGWAMRFREDNIRPMGRTARGVRGIQLRDENDAVVGMAVVPPESEQTLLSVCEKGYGKRTPVTDYPTKGRGGKGVISIKTTERNGKVVAIRLCLDQDDVMMITDGGKLIRMPVDGIPTVGRNTQGVRLIRLDETESVVDVERVAEDDGDEDDQDGEGPQGEGPQGEAAPSDGPEATAETGDADETADEDAEGDGEDAVDKDAGLPDAPENPLN